MYIVYLLILFDLFIVINKSEISNFNFFILMEKKDYFLIIFLKFFI